MVAMDMMEMLVGFNMFSHLKNMFHVEDPPGHHRHSDGAKLGHGKMAVRLAPLRGS